MWSTLKVAAIACLLATPTWAGEGATSAPSAPIPYAKLVARTGAHKPVAARITTTAPASSPAGPAPISSGELGAFVDGVVTEAMARDHIAGVTVSVVQNGQIILKKGYGFASLGPTRAVDPDRTLFRIGSISQTFTWIALMKAAEAGRIRLDQPVNLYLPQTLQIPDKGFEPIRVANLMDHSAGFEDRALGQLFEMDFDRVRPLQLYLREERPKRVRPPGAIASYSNYGAALAGAALAHTSGKAYENLIEEQILLPARMAHTTFREPHPPKDGLPAPMPAALQADISQGFRWQPGGFQPQPYEFIEQTGPAGAASSTATDMARYMLLQLNGGSLDGAVIYGPTIARAFRTPLRATPPGVNGWAHGFAIEQVAGGRKAYGHDGGTLSFVSKMLIAPDLNLGVFIAANTDTGADLVKRMAPAIVRRFYGQPEPFPRAGTADLVEHAADFRGEYLSTRRPYSGLEGFVMRLAPADLAVDVSPEGRLIVSGLGVNEAFVPDGPLEAGRFIGAQDDSVLVFAMRDGRAEAFIPGSGGTRFERVAGWRKPMTLAGFAGLAGLAAMATLGGLVLRDRRELRQSALQARASLVQNIQAGLWLAALVLFGAFVAKAADSPAWAMYSWPGPLVILASASALVAALLNLVVLAALPAVWSGGRRVESWSPLRKMSFTLTFAIYAAFSVLLASWGALAPWSS